MLLTQWGWEGVPLQWAQLEQRPGGDSLAGSPGPFRLLQKAGQGTDALTSPGFVLHPSPDSLLSLQPGSLPASPFSHRVSLLLFCKK